MQQGSKRRTGEYKGEEYNLEKRRMRYSNLVWICYIVRWQWWRKASSVVGKLAAQSGPMLYAQGRGRKKGEEERGKWGSGRRGDEKGEEERGGGGVAAVREKDGERGVERLRQKRGEE